MSEDWIRVTGDNAGELRIGNRLREYGYGKAIQSIVTSTPQSDTSSYGLQWSWTARDYAGRTIDYLITRGMEHYGPDVYVAVEKLDDTFTIDTYTDLPVAQDEPTTVE